MFLYDLKLANIQPPITILPFVPDILLSTAFSNTVSPLLYFNVGNQVSYPCRKNHRKNYAFVYATFSFLDSIGLGYRTLKSNFKILKLITPELIL
jgi:hypothetical protein